MSGYAKQKRVRKGQRVKVRDFDHPALFHEGIVARVMMDKNLLWVKFVEKPRTPSPPWCYRSTYLPKVVRLTFHSDSWSRCAYSPKRKEIKHKKGKRKFTQRQKREEKTRLLRDLHLKVVIEEEGYDVVGEEACIPGGTAFSTSNGDDGVSLPSRFPPNSSRPIRSYFRYRGENYSEEQLMAMFEHEEESTKLVEAAEELSVSDLRKELLESYYHKELDTDSLLHDVWSGEEGDEDSWDKSPLEICEEMESADLTFDDESVLDWTVYLANETPQWHNQGAFPDEGIMRIVGQDVMDLSVFGQPRLVHSSLESLVVQDLTDIIAC